MKKLFSITAALLLTAAIALAQQVGWTPQQIKNLTSQWNGERFEDGRPKVPDIVLERLQNCTLEQIWGYLGRKGYHSQVEKNWIILLPGYQGQGVKA